ncbi:MAG: UDP-N-acetylglucosamine 1-carboxyvinyltransferase [Nitrospinae bacterium]|jgi:UDP-N-acetylglucosamine 1-carboxyvinyltransferase|nr:UDP-N-acetylglucosamine 1-carboxyvinyltransferase [Nitrospinota bacterium]MDA1109344.1 UDP-N-acetylglucosamine 1-carboxyvinyltransferase [Nitrospinota bacterium]
MDKLIIAGGRRLTGQVAISGAKNAVLPILAATLLTAGRNVIEGVPRVRDVTTMIRLLEELGARLESFEGDTLIIDTSGVNNSEAPYELVSTMRASCLVLGPLLSRLGKAKVSLPGGCAIGARPMDLHIKGLQTMGADIELVQGYIHGTAGKGLKGEHIYFDTVTVTGTVNLMMAAVLSEGETVLENAAKEPEVVFLADVLVQSGAKIEGQGTDVITIQGVSGLKPIECRVFPDRIEAGTYMIAAAITGGDVEITNCISQHVEPLIHKLQEAGVCVEISGTSIRVKGGNSFKGVDIKTQPHPGFPTDLQAQMMALMTLADGQSIIVENVFENRFMHAAELRRMGAKITLDGRTAIIKGVGQLSGAPLMATDLRASASLVLAALAAKGESVISRVYHIDRGYEAMENKLVQLGATIRRAR